MGFLTQKHWRKRTQEWVTTVSCYSYGWKVNTSSGHLSPEIKFRCLYITPHSPKVLFHVPSLFSLSLHLLHTLYILSRPVSQNSRFFDYSCLNWLSFLVRKPCFFLCGLTVWAPPSKSMSRLAGCRALTVWIFSFAVFTCILDVNLLW